VNHVAFSLAFGWSPYRHADLEYLTAKMGCQMRGDVHWKLCVDLGIECGFQVDSPLNLVKHLHRPVQQRRKSRNLLQVDDLTT